MFKSTKEDKYVTLKEYVANMKKSQKEIYYASGESIAKIKELPQIEKVLDKGYEVLYFTDNVDEFLTSIIREYDGKQFKSILKGDLDLDTKEEKEFVVKNNPQTFENNYLINMIVPALTSLLSDENLQNVVYELYLTNINSHNFNFTIDKYNQECLEFMKAIYED